MLQTLEDRLHDLLPERGIEVLELPVGQANSGRLLVLDAIVLDGVLKVVEQMQIVVHNSGSAAVDVCDDLEAHDLLHEKFL